MIEQLKLWEAPMERICEKAAGLNVSSFMTAPVEGEIIDSQTRAWTKRFTGWCSGVINPF